MLELQPALFHHATVPLSLSVKSKALRYSLRLSEVAIARNRRSEASLGALRRAIELRMSSVWNGSRGSYVHLENLHIATEFCIAIRNIYSRKWHLRAKNTCWTCRKEEQEQDHPQLYGTSYLLIRNTLIGQPGPSTTDSLLFLRLFSRARDRSWFCLPSSFEQQRCLQITVADASLHASAAAPPKLSMLRLLRGAVVFRPALPFPSAFLSFTSSFSQKSGMTDVSYCMSPQATCVGGGKIYT